MQVNADGFLINLHWGGTVPRLEDLPEPEALQTYRHCQHRRAMLSRQEYPARGGEFYGEPVLQVGTPDGVRTCILRYQTHAVIRKNGYEELTVMLQDKGYPLEVDLHYRAWPDSEVVERWSEISNAGNDTITLESTLSGSLNPPRKSRDYRLPPPNWSLGGEKA